jgi:hypothetical protein
MTMSDHEIRIFNLVDYYAANKGFRLSATPRIDPVTKLCEFTFTNGAETRTLGLFEEGLIADANFGALGGSTKAAIDDALAG